MLKTVSLFSGCGGSDYGAKLAGATVVFANDISRHAAKTYRLHKTLIASDGVDFREGDIQEIASLPSCDLLMGCYPCQSFTMGGPRSPSTDPRTKLYREFFRCLRATGPKYFVVENVAGMKWLEDGRYLEEQLDSFVKAGKGYRVSVAVLNAKDYGVPAERKRIFLVGVRKDLFAWYHFPQPTHGPRSSRKRPYASHGAAIAHLPLDADGEYYHWGSEEFSWWYMSRNRRRQWSDPSLTIVANWRHLPLHPASPSLVLAESDLERRSFQRWEFTEEYDVPDGHKRLEHPRRLSWRECALLQTFPPDLRPSGSLAEKHLQIGNAVPPLLMRAIIVGIVNGSSLSDERPVSAVGPRFYRRAA
jgi:DNA (cytosine-5)-methyltransferase 1